MAHHTVWDRHCCLPLRPDAEVAQLTRYRRRGGAFVSANVGYAPHSWADVLELLSSFREQVNATEGLALAGTVADIDLVTAHDDVAVAFDLEDSAPLEGQVSRIDELYQLGVRSMLLTYNHANAAGGGCLDLTDNGLTAYGRALVQRMNKVGMQVDASHCGELSAMETTRLSSSPVVYTHACMRGVWDHPRNVSDDQARACADSGGVVGITGVGVFLGPNDATVEAMCRHVEYALELVGEDHVGISTDFNFDHADFLRQLRDTPELFPDDFTRWGPVEFVSPEALCTVSEALTVRGHDRELVGKVVGANFRRAAQQTWL